MVSIKLETTLLTSEYCSLINEIIINVTLETFLDFMLAATQPAVTSSKLAIETLEQGVEYNES